MSEETQTQEQQTQTTQTTQTQTLDWIGSLPPEHKDFAGIKGWKQPSDVIKGYQELERYVGYDKIPAPRKRADGSFEDGEMQRVMKALGLPNDYAGYKIPEVNLPEGMTLKDEFMAGFKERAHKAGVLPSQFEFIMKELGEVINQGHAQQQEAVKQQLGENEKALRGKWGLAYEEKSELTKKLIKEYAGENAGKILDKYGNDPLIKELLASIGSDMSEESLERVNMSGVMLSPEAAKLEMKKIRGDVNHPYFKEGHPDHEYWVNRVYELQKMAGA